MEQGNQSPNKTNEGVENFIKNLSPNERTVLSVLIGWLLIQFCLLVFSPKKAYAWDKDHFWPFEGTYLEYYSFLEFFIYGVIPLGVFAINQALKSSSKNV